jgi:hypothetical protein
MAKAVKVVICSSAIGIATTKFQSLPNDLMAIIHPMAVIWKEKGELPVLMFLRGDVISRLQTSDSQ